MNGVLMQYLTLNALIAETGLNFSPSTAIFKLAIWKKDGILSGEDFEDLIEKNKNALNQYATSRADHDSAADGVKTAVLRKDRTGPILILAPAHQQTVASKDRN